jgi:hypothetical protein
MLMSLPRRIAVLSGDIGRFQRNKLPTFLKQKMEAVYYPKMLLSTYKSTWHYNPEDQYQHLLCHEKQKSHTHTTYGFVYFNL